MHSDYMFLRQVVLDKGIHPELREEALDRLLLQMEAAFEYGKFVVPSLVYSEVVTLMKGHNWPKANTLLRNQLGINVKEARTIMDAIEAELKGEEKPDE